jgi:hypothetical protein
MQKTATRCWLHPDAAAYTLMLICNGLMLIRPAAGGPILLHAPSCCCSLCVAGPNLLLVLPCCWPRPGAGPIVLLASSSCWPPFPVAGPIPTLVPFYCTDILIVGSFFKLLNFLIRLLI